LSSFFASAENQGGNVNSALPIWNISYDFHPPKTIMTWTNSISLLIVSDYIMKSLTFLKSVIWFGSSNGK
jgi:hypothetical protein